MKMRGFMCQTRMASLVCKPSSSAVIVPRKISSCHSESDDSSSSSCSSARFMRLVESQGLDTSARNQRTSSKKSSEQASRNIREQPKLMASFLATPGYATDDVFQVVVMKVSIHCQGCAGKVKKHLSKMQGVTSFSIDVETKRVAVMGHVSPEWVLESLSKVKKAQLWTQI